VQVAKLIDSLLTSIEKLSDSQAKISVTICIIDNSDEHDSLSSFFREQQELFERNSIVFRYFSGHGNVGYGAAQNIAISVIDSDLHLMLNPDVTVEEDAFAEAVKVFENNRSVAMLSPRAENNSGEKQYLCKRFPTILTLLIRGFLPKFFQRPFKTKLERYEMRDLSEANLTERILLISGCFMLVDTKVLQEVGGFDERYFLYFEDFDLSLRIGILGGLVHSPNVRITHEGGNTAKKGAIHIWYFIKSGIRFFNKHGWRYW